MTDKIKEALGALDRMANTTAPEYYESGQHITDYETIRNALQAQEWQPIESAPRENWKQILLYGEGYSEDEEAYVGMWLDS
jgi:hypothetical protein